ncbi:MAG: phosphatidate cytidylyltransferase [Elusimicrobia bacterium CG08_land_8_20_14_0_20_51_18]|nr:MAG: phosphatidate cytidylyltransferase [Elusimicrobia bacterium CG08_land_8_20_14_0_20_51_18]
MLLPRIITAVLGIPVVVSFVYFGGLPYFFFVFLIVMLSLYEYSTLLKIGLKPVERFSLFFFGALIPAALYLNGDNTEANLSNFIPLIISLSVISSLVYELFASEKYLERVAYTIFGIFMISWNLSHLILIRDLRPDGRLLTFAIIITVWTMDTAAYFIGRRFGRRKLSPVSPKKTVEGFLAGLFSSVLCLWIFHFFMDGISTFNMVLIGLIIGIAGQLSDLAESLIKRAVGAKDSSNLLPGHGGILDRFDSYIFIAPLVYYFVILAR